MSLYQILNKPAACPICKTITTPHVSHKNYNVCVSSKEVTIEGSVSKFNSNLIKKYDFTMHIDCFNNFYVNFFSTLSTGKSEELTLVPIKVVTSLSNGDSFKKFKIYLTCNGCKLYNLQYSNAMVDFSHQCISEPQIDKEFIQLPDDIVAEQFSEYQKIKIYNNYIKNQTSIYYNDLTSHNSSEIELPLIKCQYPILDYVKKIKKLISLA